MNAVTPAAGVAVQIPAAPVGATTVRVEPGEVIALRLALMLLDPSPTDEASPLDPAALLTMATVVLDEAQVTAAVRSCVELSEYVPVAMKGWVEPFAMVAADGVSWMDTRVAAVTVSAAPGEVIPLKLAVILLEPGATAEAMPLDPAALLMLATAGLDEFQVTTAVRS
jgi:hypothetical protein